MAEEGRSLLVDAGEVPSEARSSRVLWVLGVLTVAVAAGCGWMVFSGPGTSNLRPTGLVQKSAALPPGLPAPALPAPPPAPPGLPMSPSCQVVSETKDRIQFLDGGYITYTEPDIFLGKFYKNLLPVKDVKDLPRCLTKLWLRDPDLGGDVSDLPKALTNLSLPGAHSLPGHFVDNAQITGNLKDLPPHLEYLDLKYTSHYVTGDLKNLPSKLVHLSLGSAQNVTGQIEDLPKQLLHVDLFSAVKVTGSLEDLPKKLRFVNFAMTPTIQGDIQTLPKTLTGASFHKGVQLHGDIKDLPRGLTHADFHDAKLHGNINQLPPHLGWADFSEAKGIQGQLSEAPNHLWCTRTDDQSRRGFWCHPHQHMTETVRFAKWQHHRGKTGGVLKF